MGFQKVGVAAVGEPDAHEARLRAWLARGLHGPLDYMERTEQERQDILQVMPSARSVIALAMSYYRPEYRPEPPLRVSRYAVGQDYHGLIRKRIRKLRRRILEWAPAARVKPTVDTSPILERAWAERSGLSWTGKSCMAIAPDLGTYFFLATLVTDLQFETGEPIPDRCGSCTRCLDACPTAAFEAPGVLDARRCITTWNVEARNVAGEELPDLHGWLVGCDVCQEVCPWNKFAVSTSEPAFLPRPGWAHVAPEALEDSASVSHRIRGTAVQRTGAEAIQRNARVILGKPRDVS